MKELEKNTMITRNWVKRRFKDIRKKIDKKKDKDNNKEKEKY